MKIDELRKLIKEELGKVLSEDKPLWNMDGIKSNYIKGIQTIIQTHPELPLQDFVDKQLGERSLEDLSNEEAMELNMAVQRKVGKLPSTPPPPTSKINPYDKDASLAYMGSKYRGD